MSKSKGPQVPQIYDVMVAVEEMDKIKKDTPEYKMAHQKTMIELNKYNLFFSKNGFGTNIGKVRDLIRFRNKRLAEEKKQRELGNQFKQAQNARQYQEKSKKRNK